MKKLEMKNLTKNLIIENDPNILKQLLMNYHPYDCAIVFRKLPMDTLKKILNNVDVSCLGLIFTYLESLEASILLNEIDIKRAALILSKMEPDDATNILQNLDENIVDDLLKLMEKDDASDINNLLKYKEHTAGAVMSNNFIHLSVKMDVKEAMKVLIKEANDSEFIEDLFITDQNILVGVITLKDLIIARANQKIEDIIKCDISFVDVHDEISLVIQKMKDLDITSIPVVEKNKLVGIITIDDVIDEAIDDIDTDYVKMVGINEGKKTLFLGNVFKRLPWLICLLIVSLLISNLTALFENVIVQVTVFAFFQSLVFDMAGNAGTQSLGVAIRLISKHEMDEKKDIHHHIFKELCLSIIQALLLGILTFGMCYLYLTIIKDHNLAKWLVSLIISISLILSLVITQMLGIIIPLFFHKIKLDPAIASGPLITTISDILAIVIYFGLATIFLSQIIGG